MIDSQVEIPTKDGKTTTFITHPERGGPFPVVIFYMDAPAIREELRDMARRLGTSGYYVMLPNMYYRAGVMELAVAVRCMRGGAAGAAFFRSLWASMEIGFRVSRGASSS